MFLISFSQESKTQFNSSNLFNVAAPHLMTLNRCSLFICFIVQSSVIILRKLHQPQRTGFYTQQFNGDTFFYWVFINLDNLGIFRVNEFRNLFITNETQLERRIKGYIGIIL